MYIYISIHMRWVMMWILGWTTSVRYTYNEHINVTVWKMWWLIWDRRQIMEIGYKRWWQYIVGRIVAIYNTHPHTNTQNTICVHIIIHLLVTKHRKLWIITYIHSEIVKCNETWFREWMSFQQQKRTNQQYRLYHDMYFSEFKMFNMERVYIYVYVYNMSWFNVWYSRPTKIRINYDWMRVLSEFWCDTYMYRNNGTCRIEGHPYTAYSEHIHFKYTCKIQHKVWYNVWISMKIWDGKYCSKLNSLDQRPKIWMHQFTMKID